MAYVILCAGSDDEVGARTPERVKCMGLFAASVNTSMCRLTEITAVFTFANNQHSYLHKE